MHRRRFVASLAATGLLGPSAVQAAADAFAWQEATIAQLQAAMDARRTTARALVDAYVRRIEAVDRRGPRLASVIELNPDARAIADSLDGERRAKGARSALHGIPILLKDNIATGDRMSTSAGSLALQGVRAPRDAHLVARLREAGAVILGKTNLSEWANIRSSHSTSGWSARGGLTRNPYALDRNPSGSSSGSAVAVAANLAAAAIGTETDGSIVSPASINGLVGLKPTVGRVSRDGIVPISQTQDTAGPMTRTVADAVLLLAAIAGRDARDGATASAPAFDARRADPAGAPLQGVRLGVVRKMFGPHEGVNAVAEKALATLKALGATLVDPVELKDFEKIGDAELELLLHELKAGLAAYLPAFAPGAPVRTLADVIAWNEKNRARELAWFGQDLLERAEATTGLDSTAYRQAFDTCRRIARIDGIDATLSEHRLDALVAPTGSTAWLTDPINGDSPGASFSSPAAMAGYPHVTVPAGFVHGLPVGFSFVGQAWSEAALLRYAAAFERATSARRPPTFARTAAA